MSTQAINVSAVIIGNFLIGLYPLSHRLDGNTYKVFTRNIGFYGNVPAATGRYIWFQHYVALSADMCGISRVGPILIA